MEENKKNNIAEFLLNAPKGLTLYSPIVGNVIFDEVKNRTWDEEEVEETNLLIFTHIQQKEYSQMVFYEDGRYRVSNQDNNGECLLFPSKENTTWDFWQQSLFKRGDFVYDDEMEECLFLEKSIDGDELEMRNCARLRRDNDFRSLRYANTKEIAYFKENLLQYGFYFDENDQSIRTLDFDQDATPTKEKHEETINKDAFSEILKRIEKIEKKLDNIYDEL